MTRLAPILIATGVALSACSGGATRTVALPGGVRAKGSDLERAVRSLCDAADQAGHDPAKAGSTFYLRSHTELHSLASATGVVDRARSGRLLEAMYAVEQDVAAKPTRSSLGLEIGRLAAQSGEDLAVLHLPVPSCTTRSRP